MERFTIRLAAAAQEMAREEIQKQTAFLSKEISGIEFSGDGQEISFMAPAEKGHEISSSVQKLASRIERGLRDLQRKVLLRTPEMDTIKFPEKMEVPGVHFLGAGQVALEGISLALFRYFDRVFETFGSPWCATPLLTPTLIPTRVLARCDYFRSFPQYVTFASHLGEDMESIERFRARHQNRDDLDDAALADMDRPCACLSPAVCYHVYHLHEGCRIPSLAPVYGVCGKCFRFESSNLKDLRRLWDFTMREVVFMGSRTEVLKARERSLDMMSAFLRDHRLAGEIRTASDPFFIAPDAVSKTYFQLSSDSKFEVSLQLRGGERLAVGSHNYHSDFFGRAFGVDVQTGGPMHSVCVAFGLERWVYAFVEQHGREPENWPDPVRRAPEFASLTNATAIVR